MQDIGPLLPEIAAPTLFMWGMEDDFLGPEYPLWLAAGMQRASVHVMDRVSHHLQGGTPPATTPWSSTPSWTGWSREAARGSRPGRARVGGARAAGPRLHGADRLGDTGRSADRPPGRRARPHSPGPGQRRAPSPTGGPEEGWGGRSDTSADALGAP